MKSELVSEAASAEDYCRRFTVHARTSYQTTMETLELRPEGQERWKGHERATQTAAGRTCCQIRSRSRCRREEIQAGGGLQSHKPPDIPAEKSPSICLISTSRVMLRHKWLRPLASTALFPKQCLNGVNLSCNLPFLMNPQQKPKRPPPPPPLHCKQWQRQQRKEQHISPKDV